MADKIGEAYGVWTEAHSKLIDAERALAALPLTATAAQREAMQARVRELRARSDELLAAANALLHASSSTQVDLPKIRQTPQNRSS